MELASARPSAIRLELGEPDFETPPHVIDAACAAARDGYTKYTASRGLLDLRRAIATKLERVNAIAADPTSEIIVTAGAANAILVTLAAVVEIGDAVLVPDPGWPNYSSMSRMLGLRAVRYPLRRDEGFQPDVEALAHMVATEQVGAIIVNSPSNPTGTTISPDRLRHIMEIAERAGATLISDECYDQIRLDETTAHTSPASLDPDARVVSVFSMSKTYAMTGWRIGYLTGPAALTEHIARIQETWLSCTSAPVQKAAEAALIGDQSCVDRMVAAYRRRRSAALQAARDLALQVHPPDGAFYMMVDVGRGTDGRDFARGLLHGRGVAVAPGETFGLESRGMVRLSLAASEDDIVKGLHRLQEHLHAS